MKTIEQVTDDILDRNYGHLDPDGEGNFSHGLAVALGAGDVDYDGIRAMIAAAIEADRAQRAVCPHDDVIEDGVEPDGATIYHCRMCGERWNGGAE